LCSFTLMVAKRELGSMNTKAITFGGKEGVGEYDQMEVDGRLPRS
jgi:hypothetical protein